MMMVTVAMAMMIGIRMAVAVVVPRRSVFVVVIVRRGHQKFTFCPMRCTNAAVQQQS